MKVGLVLEGGAMRGMYTAGVLDVFMENDVKVDGIVGASAGALFGVNYLSKQAGRVIRYNKKYNSDKNYMGIRPLLKEGNLISTEYAYDIVPRKLDPFDNEKFMESGVPFYAVVTEVESGKPEYIQIKDVYSQMDSLRASGSMPLVSKPVEIDGKMYLDGGIADSIPFEWFSTMGYDKLIVVLTRDMEYRKKPMSAILTNRYKKKYPALAESLKNRHAVYNRSVEVLKEWEKEGRAFVIRPSVPIGIKRTEKDPEKLQSVYDLGISDCKACLDKVRAYISQD